MERFGDLRADLGGVFAHSGYSLYLVGGALRDELLGSGHDDLDFATDARPEETAQILEALPGISLYRIGERFGTIGVAREGRTSEITTFRSAETYAPGSRKPEVQFGHTIEEDLSRRDFTINAMARGISAHGEEGELVDPYGGVDDLQRKVVKAVGQAEDRFREDPLRILRGIRFAASLGFRIEESTWAAMVLCAALLPQLARERVADEFNRIILGRTPSIGFGFLRDSGSLTFTVPQLLDLNKIPDQGPYHRYSLWEHTFRVVDGVPPDLTTRWAALLHDIAKPETMTRDADGRIRFFGHDDIGAEKAAAILNSLAASNELTGAVRLLVQTHMQLHQYTPEWSDGAVRRLCWKLGNNFDRAIELAQADARGHGENPWSRSGAAELRQRAMALTESLPEATSPLDGQELMDHYGRPPGPWIATVKDALTDLVTEGRLGPEDKDGAWTEADRLMAEMPQ